MLIFPDFWFPWCNKITLQTSLEESKNVSQFIVYHIKTSFIHQIITSDMQIHLFSYWFMASTVRILTSHVFMTPRIPLHCDVTSRSQHARHGNTHKPLWEASQKRAPAEHVIGFHHWVISVEGMLVLCKWEQYEILY